MIFKRIEMLGFKSFADKIDISFDGGITGIVGPNGCGKSNVADAIRWVLGEQSTKLLRGSSMQDVIFNGTERRKSLSYCEVALHFDNSERVFNIDYNEVVISRKLYRSGESEYAINREPCRLKEIVSLLHDVGIGKEGYSIIGQGKVEEIISSKPENRRAIFEEAAGIAKHKAQKLESERKLERTRENLVRITDIRTEIERQLGPTLKQAETAKKYLALRDSLKTYEINNYIYKYEQASDLKKEISDKIAEINEELEQKTKDLTLANENYAASLEKVSQIDQSISKLHEEILNLTVALEKQAGESKLYEERLNFLNEQKDKFSKELEELKTEITNFENQKLSKQTLVIEKQKLFEKLKEESEKLTREYLEVVDEIAKGEDAINSEQREMILSLDSLAQTSASLSKFEAESEANSNKIEEIKQKILQESSNLTETRMKKAELKKQKEKIEVKKAEVKADANKNAEKLISLDGELDRLNGEEVLLKSRISSLESRFKVLNEMKEMNEGYQSSVRKLLNDSKEKAELSRKIVGTVANLFKVEKQFETAVELSLGGAVSNVVTENEDDAKSLIAYLKNNNLGRATFLPVSTMKPRRIESSFMTDVKNLSFGIASDLISFDKKYLNVFESLLGATVICQNLDKAVELAKRTKYSFRIVTLDGDILSTQGSFAGGSKVSGGVGLLSREREISSLKEEIEKTKQNLEITLKNKEKVSVQIAECEKIEADFDEKLAIFETELVKVSEQLFVCEGNEVVLEKEIETLKLASQDAENKLSELKESITSIKSEQNTLSGNKSSANETIEEKQKEFETLKQKREEYSEKVTNIKIQIAQTQSELVSINADLERIDGEIKEKTVIKQETFENLVKAEKAIEACEKIMASYTVSSNDEETKKKLEEVKNSLENIEIYKKQEQDKMKKLEEERSNLSSEFQRIQDKKYAQEVSLTKVDSDIETMQDKIFEDYELTYATALEFKEENYDLHFGLKEANNLRKEINALGHVNVNAIEDSKELGERYETYKTQEEDLLKAEADIVQAIKELSDEMTKKFNEDFAKIKENFSKIFKELFGGGNAGLVLLESDDPLNAGIEIVAQPPGKTLQSITLLSGGEKALTAIAILFAILKLRPMPFCLLDEIEAALDDANVVRFASYLRRFSQETQFIVITHRKPTMELADSLFGVTMEEKGVSKIVSVKLNDAIAKAI